VSFRNPEGMSEYFNQRLMQFADGVAEERLSAFYLSDEGFTP
jgi:hypothetical protein